MTRRIARVHLIAIALCASLFLLAVSAGDRANCLARLGHVAPEDIRETGATSRSAICPGSKDAGVELLSGCFAKRQAARIGMEAVCVSGGTVIGARSCERANDWIGWRDDWIGSDRGGRNGRC